MERRKAAVEAVGKIGPPAATEEVLARMSDLQRDDDGDTRHCVVVVVEAFHNCGLRFFSESAPANRESWLARTIGELSSPSARERWGPR